MRRALWCGGRLLLLVGLGVCTASSGAAVVVLPADSTVDGKTIGEYSAEWWQACVSTPITNGPVVGNSGPVVFLAAFGANDGGTTSRSYTVPQGKYLMVPLVAGAACQANFNFDRSGAEVRQFVAGVVDTIDELHATIDGQAVPELFGHRADSPDFTWTAVPNNYEGAQLGFSGIAVADGYWLMLAPPAPGSRFTMNFGGGTSAHNYSMNITDTITVVPEPFGGAVIGLAGLGHVLARRRRA